VQLSLAYIGQLFLFAPFVTSVAATTVGFTTDRRPNTLPPSEDDTRKYFSIHDV